MRKKSALLALLLAGDAVSLVRASNAASTSPAQVALDVSDFHSIDEPGIPYVEAATVLVSHPSVTLASQDGLPTLTARRAVTFEVSVVSADSDETYTPIAVVFEQQDATSDPAGARNFTVTPTAHGTLYVTDRFATTGAGGRFEFFVVVRRNCDGAIGVIDPGIVNRP